jgi:hypothetical protein
MARSSRATDRECYGRYSEGATPTRRLNADENDEGVE